MYNRAIAHELNTPLAVIQTELSLLPKKLQKLPELLSLQDEIHTMKQTIEALLVLTQGNQEIQRESRNTKDLWDQISQEIPYKIEYTGTFPILQIHEGLFTVFLKNIARNIARYAQE
jgi:signal transduction histidine kinase